MSSQNPYGSDPYGSQPGSGQPVDPTRAYDQQNPASGQNPSGQNPYGSDQYGSQPGSGQPMGSDPYGQQGSDPYGQQPGSDPYGQQAGSDPYGQQPGSDPYGQQPGSDPYGQQAPQYGSEAPSYASPGASSDQFQPAYGSSFGPDPYASGYGSGGGDSRARNVLGILAIIAGVVAILVAFGSWVPFLGFIALIGGGIIAIVAIILGIVGLSAVRKGKATNKGMNITGIILGAAAILLAVALTVVQLFIIDSVGKGIDTTTGGSTGAPKEPSDSATEPGASEEPSEDASSPAAEGSGGSEGESVAIASGVNLRVSVAEEKADPVIVTANNGEIARVVYTFENTTDKEFDPGFVSTKCSYSGGSCQPAFDGKDYRGDLVFDSIPAGETKEFAVAYEVPNAEVNSVKLEVTVPNSDQGYSSPYLFERG